MLFIVEVMLCLEVVKVLQVVISLTIQNHHVQTKILYIAITRFVQYNVLLFNFMVNFCW